MKDKLYEEAGPRPFEFNESVVSVFDDMISRSVPGYHNTQMLSAELARVALEPNSVVVDIGCSTGKSFLQIEACAGKKIARYVGYDTSAAMLERCRENCRELEGRIELHQQSAETVEFPAHNLCLLNYTLQFVKPESRTSLIKNIWKSLAPGGSLLVSEKVIHNSPVVQKLLTALHEAFKEKNGYSKTEISRKREALENVLVPLTLEENVGLIQSAGFDDIQILAKNLNFCTLLGTK